MNVALGHFCVSLHLLGEAWFPGILLLPTVLTHLVWGSMNVSYGFQDRKDVGNGRKSRLEMYRAGLWKRVCGKFFSSYSSYVKFVKDLPPTHSYPKNSRDSSWEAEINSSKLWTAKYLFWSTMLEERLFYTLYRKWYKKSLAYDKTVKENTQPKL